MLGEKDAGFGPVRIVDAPAFTIAGFGERYTVQTSQDIPALWRRFAEYVGKVPGQIGSDTFGLCCNPDGKGGFEYIAGVEVRRASLLPPQYRWYTLEPQRYAVFEHHGAIGKIGHTFEKIWKHWLPASIEQAAEAPEFERYAADFEPDEPGSVVQIWIPLLRR